jgi:hypothetical protein
MALSENGLGEWAELADAPAHTVAEEARDSESLQLAVPDVFRSVPGWGFPAVAASLLGRDHAEVGVAAIVPVPLLGGDLVALGAT